MEVVKATLWTVLMVTVVTSEPVCLHVEDDSSESSESSESMSSEEIDVQPALPDTGMQVDHLALSPSSIDTAALSEPEDPQTSTDIEPLQPLPENPCETAFHVKNSHDTARDSPDATVTRSTNKPKGTSTYEGLQQEATPPVPMLVLTPTALRRTTDTPLKILAEDTPLKIPAEDTPANAPDCFTIQLTTPESAPPRGDSI